MWDFILPNSDTKNEQEVFPVSTRSKGAAKLVQPTPNKKNMGPTTKDKVPTKKSTTVPTQNQPSSSNPPSSSKTLVVVDSMDYNIIEDMKKNRSNISLFELSKLKHQQKLLLKELNAVPSSPLPNVILPKAANEIGKPTSDRVDSTNVVLIEDRYNSHTPPFLLIYEIYN